MSSRNKRKRPENGGETTATTPRRRASRSGAEPNNLTLVDNNNEATAPNNEGGSTDDIDNNIAPSTLHAASNNNNNNNNNTVIGESSAPGAPPSGTATTPQHAQAAAAVTALPSETDKIYVERMNQEGKNASNTVASGSGSASDMARYDSVQQTEGNDSPITTSATVTPALPSGFPLADPSVLVTSVDDTSNNTRERKLRSMIQHRKLLLERVKGGRSAARSRIVDIARRDAAQQSLQKSSGDPSKGNAAVPPAAHSEKARDEAELSAFKKLTRKAAQAAKKQRIDAVAAENAAAAEKRSSVSLRKGASVGKNMKAALSSLVPGGGYFTANAPTLASTTTQPMVKATDAAPTVAHRATSATIIPGQRPLPTKKQKSIAAAGATAAGNSIPKAARNANQKNMKSFAHSATISSHKSATSLPLHAGLATAPGLPAQQLQRGSPPFVCPEAVALRNRKKAVQIKLLDHFKERQRRLLQQDTSKRRGSDTSHSASSSIPSLDTEDQQKIAAAATVAMNATAPRPASYLPRRRKTHWDTLLEEMKWMATDFLEERKWKISAARTIGSAVQARIPGRKGATNKPTGDVEDDTAMVIDRSVDKAEDSHTSDKEEKPNGKGLQLSKSTPSKEKSAAERKPSKVSSTVFYSVPTDTDTDSSKKVASIISSMAHELGSATLKAHALPRIDKAHMKALERHVATRRAIEQGKNATCAAATFAKKEESATDRENGSPQNMEVDDAKAKKEKDSKSKEVSSFERICQEVEALSSDTVTGKAARKPARRGRQPIAAKADGVNVVLTTWQVEATEFVERKWGNENSRGAIICGPRASGKTIAVCSLLWKRRSAGPQLLVCSPYRVVCMMIYFLVFALLFDIKMLTKSIQCLRQMNWMHAIKRFEGLRIKPFGFSAGISSPFSGDRKENYFEDDDVVICEYSALKRLQQSDFSCFESLVLDCRYPRGFQGSRRHSVFDDTVIVPDNTAHAIKTAPADLISEVWWEHLVNMSANHSLNRLVIENPKQATVFNTAVGLSEMQRVEVVALRFAFLLGAEIFASPTSSVKKRILTWARRRTKAMVDSPKNKIKAVQKFLMDLVHPFYCPERIFSLELVSHDEWNRLDIKVRTCSLSHTERQEYEECCLAVRGALSLDIHKSPGCEDLQNESFKSISGALLRLRRQCVHTQLPEILMSPSMRSRLGSYTVLEQGDPAGFVCNHVLSRKIKDSASQTDSELAASILNGSAKCRELVSMLRNECDYSVGADEELLDGFLEAEKGRGGKAKDEMNPNKTPKRVVILAMLPEVQLLISVLLNCLGISHELLLRPLSRGCSSNVGVNDAIASLIGPQSDASILAWIECQQALSRFNTLDTSNSDRVATNLVVTSPDMIAGDHGGVGVGMADVIVSVDEDWSGRNELIMRSLVADLIPPNSQAKEKGCEFVRLVCENTCEENFLSMDADMKNPGQSTRSSSTDSWPWRIDAFGSFDTKDLGANVTVDDKRKWPWRKSEEIMFGFPAVNLLRFRNKNLSEILAIKDGLPPNLGDGSPVLFLPKKESDGLSLDERKLVVRIMETEEDPHILCKDVGIRTSNPSSFRTDVVTRSDLDVIAIRLYVEHFSKARIMKQSLSPSIQAVAGGGQISSAMHAISEKFDDEEAVEPWNTLGDGVDAVNFASLLLFYIQPTGEKGRIPREPAIKPLLRTNKYVDAFNEFLETTVKDGKQGSEALVYFPPLLPKLQECARQARMDITSKALSREKRPVPDTPEDFLVKRLKVDDSAVSAAFSGNRPGNVQPMAISEDEALHSDAASFLLDLDEDFGLIGVGAIPHPTYASVASLADSLETGRYSLDADQALLQSDWSNDVTQCDFEELDCSRVAQPNENSLGSVVLFVGRRPRQRLPVPVGNMVRPPGNLASAAIPGGSVGLGNGAIHDMNGDSAFAKKTKKTLPTLVNSSSSLNPGTTSQIPMNVQIAKVKESYNRKILSFLTSRQKALGMTMFESSTYCSAAVRFRDRANDRAAHQNLVTKAAFNDPFMPPTSGSTLWASVAKKLKTVDSDTGDDARVLAESQLLAMRRSLSAPSCIDFGPFQGGFLSPIPGMSGITPPRSRVGVTLPMGVKIPLNAQQQIRPTWNAIEDKILQDCAVRFGKNWILAARMLTGYDDVIISSASQSTTIGDEQAFIARSHEQRSARTCRDRWQALVLGDSSLVQAAWTTPKDLTVDDEEPINAKRLAEVKPGQAGSEYSVSFLFPSELIAENTDTKSSAGKTSNSSGKTSNLEVHETVVVQKKDATANEPNKMDVDVAEKPENPKKSFGTLMTARSKTQLFARTIPGVAPGAQPSFVPSHPSHAQSVQTSIAATWTNGRTEMWPLQFLDVSEKQRAAQAASTAAVHSPPLSGGSRASSSSRSRPPSSAASMPAFHQAAAQAYVTPGAKPTSAQRTGVYHPQAAAHGVPMSRSPRHHPGHLPQQRMSPSAASRPSTSHVTAPRSSTQQPSVAHRGTPHPPPHSSTAPHAAAGVPPANYAAHTPITQSQQHLQQTQPAPTTSSANAATAHSAAPASTARPTSIATTEATKTPSSAPPPQKSPPAK